MKLRRIALYLYVVLLGIIMIFFVKLNSDEIVKKYTYTIQDLSKNIMYIWLIVLVFISIIAYVYTKKLIFVKVKEKYYRDYKDVLSPILSEYVIDENCDIQNLILSCIVDLIERKKIENIDNKKIRLVSTDGLSDVEEDIVTHIFPLKTEIEFKELNLRNSRNSKTTYEWFSKIKKDIIMQLYKDGIYDVGKKKLVKCLSFFQKFIYFQILFIVMLLTSGDMNSIKEGSVFKAIVFFAIFSIISVFVYKSYISKSIDKELSGILLQENDIYNKYKLSFKIFFIFIVMIMISMVWIVSNSSLWLIIPMLLGIIVNEMHLKFDRCNVLTNQGKEEYKKIYGLKNYIKDYSIMKKNEMDYVEIWDSYLTYAIAFGVANRVLKKVDKYGLLTDVLIDSLNL